MPTKNRVRSASKKISFLDAYDWARQVIRHQSGFDNIRRDDELQGVPRLGFNSGALRNLHASLLRRFDEVELTLPFSDVRTSDTVEDLVNAIWSGIPNAHKS